MKTCIQSNLNVQDSLQRVFFLLDSINLEKPRIQDLEQLKKGIQSLNNASNRINDIQQFAHSPLHKSILAFYSRYSALLEYSEKFIDTILMDTKKSSFSIDNYLEQISEMEQNVQIEYIKFAQEHNVRIDSTIKY